MGWRDAPVVDTPPGFAADVPAPGDAPPDLGVTETVPAGQVTTPLAWRRPPVPSGPIAANDLPPGFVADQSDPTPDSLRASYRAVQDVNPDEQGRIVRISRETGVPVDVVAADPEGLARAVPPPQLALLPSHAPALAAHVQDPANMAAAKDDLEQLSALEWYVTGGLIFGANGETRYQPPAIVEAYRKAAAQLRLDFEKTGEKFGLRLSRLGLSPAAEAQAWVQERHEEDVAAAGRDVKAEGLGRLVVGAGEAAPFVALNIVAGAFGPAAMLVVNTLPVAGRDVEQLEQVRGPEGQRLSPGAAKAAGAATALVEGAIYSFGLGKVGKSLAGPIARRLPGEILEKALASTTLPKAIASFVVRMNAPEDLDG